jgi:5-methyltetrahydrofolate--homocysteine methyltransferase
MIPAIMAVGDLYDKKIYFLPQLMQSAEAMKAGTRYLEPALKESKAESRGTIVIATVKGDIHDIGKNIVAIILENYGFKVIDLGKDIAKEVILEKALEHKADIISLSALMTTTMVEMEQFMSYMRDAGHKIPVMIGGAVVNERYAQEIGAQYSKDAVGATELAGKIMALKKS